MNCIPTSVLCGKQLLIFGSWCDFKGAFNPIDAFNCRNHPRLKLWNTCSILGAKDLFIAFDFLIVSPQEEAILQPPEKKDIETKNHLFISGFMSAFYLKVISKIIKTQADSKLTGRVHYKIERPWTRILFLYPKASSSKRISLFQLLYISYIESSESIVAHQVHSFYGLFFFFCQRSFKKIIAKTC